MTSLVPFGVCFLAVPSQWHSDPLTQGPLRGGGGGKWVSGGRRGVLLSPSLSPGFVQEGAGGEIDKMDYIDSSTSHLIPQQ